jgi:hypothetical protein
MKKIQLDAFVEILRPDPKSNPELVIMQGYIGASAQENSIRLYSNEQLNSFFDILEEDILFEQKRDTKSYPLGGSMIWCKAGTKTKQGNADASSYLQGDIMNQINIPINTRIHTVCACASTACPSAVCASAACSATCMPDPTTDCFSKRGGFYPDTTPYPCYHPVEGIVAPHPRPTPSYLGPNGCYAAANAVVTIRCTTYPTGIDCAHTRTQTLPGTYYQFGAGNTTYYGTFNPYRQNY